jgi:hypothetical protein
MRAPRMDTPTAPIERRGVPRPSRTPAFLAAVLLYLVATGVTARNAWRDQDWNFDCVMYIGVALAHSIHDPVELHRAAYSQLERGIPPAAFRAITSDNAYRKAVFESPEAFATQRVFYDNKPLYGWGVATLHALGMNSAHATRALSVASTAGIALALLVAIWLAGGGAGHILAAGVLVNAPPMIELGIWSTPDAMGCLPLLVGGLLYLRGQLRAGLVAFAVALLVRPDLGLLVVMLVAWATLAAPAGVRLTRRAGAILGACVLAGSYALQKLAGGAPLRVVWRHSYESRLYDPARMHEQISWAGYWAAFKLKLLGDDYYHQSLLFLHLGLAVVAGLFVQATAPPERRRAYVGWMLAVWAYVPLHFVLFPERVDRYFTPTYVLSLAAVLLATVPVVRRVER